MKTLCGSNLKLIIMKAQGEDVVTIQIRLKQPKRARTQPTRIVELPATGGWICPVMAFRPALPSILAREGALEEKLKALGRWSSKTYKHYVKEGRTGDWKGLLQKLRKMAI